MKSCTLSSGGALTRIAARTGLMPVLAVLGFFCLAVFPNVASAQVFTELTGAGNPLLGKTTGTFSSPVFADLDGDLDLDMLSGTGTGATGGRFIYFINTGTASAPVFSGPASPNPFAAFDVGFNAAPTFVDVNEDGRMDMVSGAADGTLYYFQNIGTPTVPSFSPMTGINNPFDGMSVGGSLFSTPTAGDVDGDLDVDLVVGRQDGRFRYIRNDGGGVFTLLGVNAAGSPFSTAGHDAGTYSTPSLIDIDNDGDLDCFSGNSAGQFTCYRNNGTALFAIESAMTPYVDGTDIGNPLFRLVGPPVTFDAGNRSTPTFADLDGDGDPDCVPGYSTGGFLYYQNNLCQAAPTITCVASPISRILSNSITGEISLTWAEIVSSSTVCISPFTHNSTQVLSTYELLCADLPSMTVTATVTDTRNGKSASCTVTVTLVENTPPNALCRPYSMVIGGSGSATLPATTTNAILDNASTDNCTIGASLVFNYVDASNVLLVAPPTFTCAQVGTPQTVYLRVTDASLNSSTCFSTVSLTNGVAPTPNVPALAAQTIAACGNTLTAAYLNLYYAPVATQSNCGAGTLSASVQTILPALPPFPNDVMQPGGSYTVTWQYSPPNGTTATQTQVFNVSNSAPTFVNPMLPPPNNNTCLTAQSQTVVIPSMPNPCSGTVTFQEPSAWDCVSGLPLTIAPSDKSAKPAGQPGATVFTPGSYPITYIARDANGRTAICNFTIRVVDGTMPTFERRNSLTNSLFGTATPANISVNADAGSCGANVSRNWIFSATDNCPTTGFPTLSLTSSPTAGLSVTNGGSFFPIGTTTLTYLATDAGGLTGTLTFTVTVNDGPSTPPSFTNCPTTGPVVVSNAPGQCSAGVQITTPAATDNCPGTLTYSRMAIPTALPSPLAAATGLLPGSTETVTLSVAGSPHTVHYTVSDIGNNTRTCSYQIQVNDTEKPVITCPANITATGCSALVLLPPAVSATDNCTAMPGVTGAYTYGTAPSAPAPPNTSVTFSEGLSTVTYTATDAATPSNVKTCSFTVSVTNGTVAPVIMCPSTITVNTTAGLCTGLITPPNITVTCGSGAATLAYSVGGNPIADLSVYPFSLGSTPPLRVTATKYLSALTTSCDITVTVVDNQPPTVTNCPANVTLNIFNRATCDTTYTWALPTFADHCGIAAMPQTTSHVPGATFSVGTTTVNYQRQDAAGLSVFCSFTVTVVDKTKPSITCPANMTVNTSTTLAVDCSGSATYSLTVSDNCTSTGSITVTPSLGSGLTTAAPLPMSSGSITATFTGTGTVTYTATDAALNTRSCSFSVTVRDNEGPTFTGCPANQSWTILAPSTSCSFPFIWSAPTVVSDNCYSSPTPPVPSITGLTSSPTVGLTSGSQFPVGVTTMTYTANDGRGNTSTCTFTIQVLEQVVPTIICPDPLTVTVSNIPACSTMVMLTQLGTPTVADACTALPNLVVLQPTLLPSYSTGVSGATATYPVTWRVTDASSNSATCSQNIIVRSAPPVITCPNITVNTDPQSCQASITLTPPTSTFSCASFTGGFWGNNIPGSIFIGIPTAFTSAPGQITVNWSRTYSGPYSSTVTCTQIVTVRDNNAPYFTACPATITVNGNGANCTVPASSVNYGYNTADLCGGIQGVVTAPLLTTYPSGSTSITHTVTDAGGLTGTCSQTVIVNCATACTPTSAIISGCAGTSTISTIGCSNTASFTPASVGLSAVDNCGNPLSISPGVDSRSVGTHSVAFTSALGGSCTKTIIVTGGSSPSIVCPAAVTISAPSNACAAVFNPLVQPTVACLIGTPGSFSVTSTPLAVSPTAHLVTWTLPFTSPTGSATCQQSVTVQDVTPPSLVANSCPTALTVYVDLQELPLDATDIDEKLMEHGLPSYTDNCGNVDVTNDAQDQGDFDLGTYYIRFTATDDNSLENNECVVEVEIVEAGSQNCAEWTSVSGMQISSDLSTAASGDQFGESVDVSGDWAIIGASKDDATDAGAAYIMRRVSGTWTEFTKLLPPSSSNDPSTGGDLFGASVAIDGEYAIVGSYLRDVNGTSSGAAHIYRFNGSAWVLMQELSRPDPAAGDRFGFAVDISGNYAVVGAPYNALPNAASNSKHGSIYVYQLVSGTWGHVSIPGNPTISRTSSDVMLFDEFGTSVAIEGDYIIAGAPKDDESGINSNSGAAFVFHKDSPSANAWGQVSKLVPADGNVNDNFGTSVGISAPYAMVGSNLADDTWTDEGAVYVFGATAPNNWNEEQKLSAGGDVASGAQFGFSLDMEGSNAIVGARNFGSGLIPAGAGAAYFFTETSGIWSLTDNENGIAPASNDNFGYSVAIDDCGGAVVGAYRDDAPQTDRGSVYFYSNGCACVNKPSTQIADRTGEQSTLLSGASSVRLFPNPTSDLLNIDVVLETESEVTITVTDAAGRIVSQVFSGVSAPEARYSWDASTVPSGLYFVRVDGGSLRKVVPVSVVK